MTVHERRGKWFDELVVGDIYMHRPGRTVTEADNVLFTTLTMNTQSLHLDSHFASSHEMGQRLVNSLLTMSTVVGLSVADLTEGTTVGNLGFPEIVFPHPVFLGDTIYASTEVVEVRPSRSRPGQGVATFEHRGHNQDGVPVCVARRAALIMGRPEPEVQHVVTYQRKQGS
jgi:acyl dehydratase